MTAKVDECHSRIVASRLLSQTRSGWNYFVRISARARGGDMYMWLFFSYWRKTLQAISMSCSFLLSSWHLPGNRRGKRGPISSWYSKKKNKQIQTEDKLGVRFTSCNFPALYKFLTGLGKRYPPKSGLPKFICYLYHDQVSGLRSQISSQPHFMHWACSTFPPNFLFFSHSLFFPS